MIGVVLGPTFIERADHLVVLLVRILHCIDKLVVPATQGAGAAVIVVIIIITTTIIIIIKSEPISRIPYLENQWSLPYFSS